MKKKNDCCSAPYNQVFIQSSGRVYPCAFLQNHTLLGDVKKNTIEEIWNGEEMSEFRKLHSEGTPPPRCQENQKRFFCHKFLPDHPEVELDKSKTVPPRIDFMIDSFCNLKCTMCTNVLEERGGFDDPAFWENFEKVVLPQMTEIEVIGGEPMILKNTYRLFEMIKKVNPKLKVKMTTNGHYRFDQARKDALTGVNFVKFAYSIDSLKPDVFESIRSGGDLQTALDTLEEYKAFNKTLENPIPIEVNMVIQRENAYEVPSILQFVRGHGLAPYLTLLLHPEENSLIKLSEAEQMDIFKFYLSDFKENKDPELMKLMMKYVRQMPSEMRLEANYLLSSL